MQSTKVRNAPVTKSELRRILAAVETDATRYYGPEASRPALLEPSEAQQMLAHLAADLQALLPEISRCSLIAAGALFDQTQVLRPGYPLFTALEATAADRSPERFRPGLVSIGATDGTMPVEALQPLDDIPLRWSMNWAAPWKTASWRRASFPPIPRPGCRRPSVLPSITPDS